MQSGISSTFALFWGFLKASLLGEMVDIGHVLHLRKEAAMAILTCRPRNRLLKERLRVFRHQQAQKARKARRVLDRNHQQLPKQAQGSFRPPCTGL